MLHRTSHLQGNGLAAGVRWRFATGATLGLLCLLLADTGFAAEAIQLAELKFEPVRCHTNLLSHSGFEEVKPTGIPSGWEWSRRNTDALCVTVRTQAHQGQHSLLLTNGTAFGAHVYGMLWRTQSVRLTEGQPYTMSAWVKSDAPGLVTLVGGSDWQFRAQARRTEGQWRRIWKTFTPGAKDCDFIVRINTESPTLGVWVDDVKLEPGTSPTPDPPAAGETAAVWLEADESEAVVQGDGPFTATFTLSNARAIAGTWSAALSTAGSVHRPASLPAGVWRVSLAGSSTCASDAPRTLTLRLDEANQPVAGVHIPMKFFSASNALHRLAALKAEVPALKSDLARMKSLGQDPSYPAVTASVLENFIAYAADDARRGEVRRSLEQVGDLEAMAARLRGELKETLAGQRQFPAVPRWTGEKRPAIQRSSFVAPARAPGGATVERPVFFNGYGHFGQVVSDIRAALWQAAVHGQSATAIWVWERTFDPKSDFAGSIMHRPACAEAVGLVNHDLNRAALEVTALQQARPQALLLQSVTSSVWDMGRYGDCLQKLYTALAFTGLKVGFITERQLEAGLEPKAAVLFIPAVVHCSDAALSCLQKFKGQVVFVGDDRVLTRDEYGRPRDPQLPAAKMAFQHGSTSARDLREQILSRLSAWNLHLEVEVRGPNEQPAWGVAWRSAELRGRMIVNLCNYRKEPVTVTLNRPGGVVIARDVLTGRQADRQLTLASLEVRLLELAR